MTRRLLDPPRTLADILADAAAILVLGLVCFQGAAALYETIWGAW